MVRASALQSEDAGALNHLDARVALFALGTNAVPALVEQALTTGGDSTFRRVPRTVSGALPGVVGPGRFLEPQQYLSLIHI